MKAETIERLKALHVWPQFVADTYADTLSPRQITGLYSVGTVAHEAATQGTADNERIAELEAMVAELASELEAELQAKGSYDTTRKMQRDMEPVIRARAILEGKAP